MAPSHANLGATCLNLIVCAGEWNGSGRLDSQDLFDFVADYFDLDADFNQDAVTDTRDFFE